MTHRANRVADFMRNAGAQPPQRRQFRLLDALIHQAGVFEENEHGSAPLSLLAERSEMRGHVQYIAGSGDRKLRMRRLFRVGTPATEVFGQWLEDRL